MYFSFLIFKYLCKYLHLAMSIYQCLPTYMSTYLYVYLPICLPTFIKLPTYTNLPSSTYLTLLIPKYQYIIAADPGAGISLFNHKQVVK